MLSNVSMNSNEKFEFTIQIVTYNPQWDKLRFTLDAILLQSFKNYEIQIVDDGSEDCLEELIKEYVATHRIVNFQHIKNKQNQGTVKNIISGLERAQGKYVCCFGPGDSFATIDALKMVHSYLDSNSFEACWSPVQPFVCDDTGKRKEVYRAKPLDIDAYREYHVNRIYENMIVYSDQAHGASMIMTRDKWLKYLCLIVDKVKYAEDLALVLLALEEEPVHLLDEVLIYYEVGEGISTRKDQEWINLLNEDLNCLYRLAGEMFPNNPYIKKRARLNKFQKINNLYLRTMLRFFVNPGMVFFLSRALMQRIMHKHYKQIENKIPLN